jgi:ABC-type antimicrobial peptide transport system permease subunit
MAIPLKVNLRGLLVRKVSTASTVVCLALVVAVFSTMMALAAGMAHTFKTSGDPLNVMVMRDGSTSEINSGVTTEQYQILSALPGAAKDASGKPNVTGEVVLIINQNKRGHDKGANIILRGVSPQAFAVHPDIKLVEGRAFTPGQSEVIASRSIAKKFQGCGLGEVLTLRKRQFKVVGLFDAGGTSKDSEILGDVDELRDAFERTGYFSTVFIRTTDPSGVAAIQSAIKADQRLNLKAVKETDYFAEQTQQAGFIIAAGMFLAIILAVGAGFGAANTMYAAVSSRSKEIGTLRAIGFSRFAILVAYMVEALVLGAVGGIVGILITYITMNGVNTGTINWQSFSEVSFAFRVTPVLAVIAIAFASIIGALGGFLPATLAARARITQALRQI